MKRFANIFPTVAGLILIAMASAQVIGNQRTITLQPADPLLGISSRYLFWTLAALETIVAAICLFSHAERLKHTTVFWLTSYLVLYRLEMVHVGVNSAAAYFGTMAKNFGLSPEVMEILSAFGVLGLWCGSGIFLFGAQAFRAKAAPRHPAGCASVEKATRAAIKNA